MTGETPRKLDRTDQRSRAIVLICVLAAGAALIAGCGGSSKSTNTLGTSAQVTTHPLTKAEYVAKANAICNATNGPLASVALRLANHPSPVEAAHLVASSFIPQIESQLRQIQAVGTPVGGQATVAQMDRLLADDIAKIQRNPVDSGPAAFHDFAVVAHRYGLTACAPLS